MKKFDRYGVAFWAVASLLILGVIYGQSSLSRQDSAEASGFVMNILKPFLDPYGRWDSDTFHYLIRKTGHFTEYLLLGISFANLFPCLRRGSGGSTLPVQMLAVLSVAVSDEYLQLFTGRGSAVSDVVLDYAGALAGIFLIYGIGLVLKKRRTTHET